MPFRQSTGVTGSPSRFVFSFASRVACNSCRGVLVMQPTLCGCNVVARYLPVAQKLCLALLGTSDKFGWCNVNARLKVSGRCALSPMPAVTARLQSRAVQQSIVDRPL